MTEPPNGPDRSTPERATRDAASTGGDTYIGELSSIEEIAAAVRTCTRCGLAGTRISAVPGEGSDSPSILFIGEGPGDRLEFFSEGGIMTLPNSGVMLLAATERHDYRTGCEGFSDCHGSVVRHPIAVDSLAPDIAAPWTFEVYAAGRDPGMETVARAIAGE